MAFQKGEPRHPNAGRKKGSQNIKKIAKVADLLAERDINPVQEILNILDDPEAKLFDSDRIRAWFDLLSYCQAKPKAIEVDDGDDDDDLLKMFEDVSDEALLKLVKSPDEAS